MRVDSVDQYGTITGFTITDQGSGYTLPKTLAQASSTGDGLGATVRAGDAPGSASPAVLADIGQGNGGSGHAVGDVITFEDPADPSGAPLSIRVTSVDANGKITGFDVLNSGSGYNLPKTLTQASTTGSGVGAGIRVGAEPVEDFPPPPPGVPSASSLTLSGTGHAVGDIITFEDPADPNGTPVKMRVDAVDQDGVITGFTITDPGSGYMLPKTLQQASSTGSGTSATVEMGSAPGSASPAALADVGQGIGGTGHAVGDVITFEDPADPSGTPLSIRVDSVDADGTITGFTVLNSGSGYNLPKTLTQASTTGSGTGAGIRVGAEPVKDEGIAEQDSSQVIGTPTDPGDCRLGWDQFNTTVISRTDCVMGLWWVFLLVLLLLLLLVGACLLANGPLAALVGGVAPTPIVAPVAAKHEFHDL